MPFRMGQVFSYIREKCWNLKIVIFGPDKDPLPRNAKEPLCEEQPDPTDVAIDIEGSSEDIKDDAIISETQANQTLLDPQQTVQFTKVSEAPQPKLNNYRDRSPSNEPPVVTKKIKIDYLDFPIINDQFTVNFVRKSKVCVILRGLSGSGKSFIAEYLCQQYGEDAVDCSADFFFVQEDGSYNFDASQLKDAHQMCESAARTAMKRDRPVVLINNTNVKCWEYKKYLDMAKSYNYTVIYITPITPWAWNPEQLVLKSSHGVSLEMLTVKAKQFHSLKPIYHGWFLNPVDSAVLVQKGFDTLREILKRPSHRRVLAKLANRYNNTTNNADLEGEHEARYSQCGAQGVFQRVHCTAMFANKGKVPGAEEYMQRDAVKMNSGRALNIFVTGVVVTPRTIGVRVALPHDQLDLWGQDDSPDSEIPEKIAHHFSPPSPPLEKELTNDEEMDAFFTEDDSKPVIPRDLSGSMTIRAVSFDEVKREALGNEIENSTEGSLFSRLAPVQHRGRRAHITLATANDVKPVVTGYDLLELQRRERRSITTNSNTKMMDCNSLEVIEAMDTNDLDTIPSNTNTEQCELQTLDNGDILADYGDGMFALYPHECIQVTTLFSNYC